MSRFHKILLATALIVVGFGVAKFLGQPVLLPQAFDSHSPLAQDVTAPAQAADALAEVPRIAGSVRLLPEPPIARADIAATNAATTFTEPPALGTALSLLPAANNTTDFSESRRTVDYVPIPSAPIRDGVVPQAKLRNEAPRPIGVDPQSPVAIRRIAPETSQNIDPYKVADREPAPMNWPAPRLLNVENSGAGPSPPAAITASYNAPSSTTEEPQFAPPPWPAGNTDREPRTHIIVDGDSLEKLAGRYLDDPRRSREIYELNHEVLSSPDLLPIGAELKIPERVATASWDRESSRQRSANIGTSREAANNNLIPVRPAPVPQAIVPRAQLSRPMMVQ